MVPAWEFTLPVAADDFATMPEPPWDSTHPPAGLSIESATVSTDGRTSPRTGMPVPVTRGS